MTEIITSLQNPRVKLAHQLQAKAKLRRSERKFILEGKRLVSDALALGARPLFAFYEARAADYDLVAQLQNNGTDLLPVSEEIIRHISDTQTPQGIIAVYAIPQPRLPTSPARVLVLDAVSEPGNMGTILRSAAAAGVEIILLAPDCVDPYNPKVLRSGMGSHFRIPIVEAQWSEIRNYCDHLAIYLAAGDASTPYTSVNWQDPWALVIGSEAHGIGNAARLSGTPIAIPMQANTESLNAAIAAAIIMFEARRQRSG